MVHLKVDGENKKSGDCESSQAVQSGGELGRLLKFLIGACLLTSLVFWKFTFGPLSAIWDPDVITDIGSVQRIHFVGGIGISTQIDTELMTVLVWNQVNLPKRTPLQMRQGYFMREVCVANTNRCWDASSK